MQYQRIKLGIVVAYFRGSPLQLTSYFRFILARE